MVSPRGVLRRAAKAMGESAAREFLAASCVGHLATVGSDGYPYVVPVNIGYSAATSELGTLYFHSAHSGYKLENIAQCPLVCIQVDDGGELVTGELPCQWSMRFRSVVAFGTARLVETSSERLAGLHHILRVAGLAEPGPMDEGVLARTCIVAVDIDTLTGKQSGD